MNKHVSDGGRGFGELSALAARRWAMGECWRFVMAGPAFTCKSADAQAADMVSWVLSVRLYTEQLFQLIAPPPLILN